MDGVWVWFAMRRDEKRRDGKLVEARVKGWSSLDNRTVGVRFMAMGLARKGEQGKMTGYSNTNKGGRTGDVCPNFFRSILSLPSH